MLDKKEEICEGCIQSFKRINEKTNREKDGQGDTWCYELLK